MDTDEQLYCEARLGSKLAFEALYAKYERPVFAFILRRIENREEAEEVFHEAMLSIFKGEAAEFQNGGFAAWLYKVSLNISLNRMRSRRRERVALVAYHEQGQRTGVDDCDNPVDPDTAKQLEQAVSTLKPTLRQVYNLRAQGKSYEEIATIAAVPVGTVKSRVNKMIRDLRKDISQWIAK
jgi:RNA polymerase sigma-70 factor (ECF subfamily)